MHVSSFRAYVSDPNQEGYASTKAGKLGLTQSLAITCQKWGIRVNAVLPGRVKIAHERKEGDAKGLKWNVSKDDAEVHPANRAGMPEDVADAVEYLMGSRIRK
jgi:NAD(P)-dependent dehydrogenase (short-subunit alcohol dehydrogenase family)